MSLIIEVETKFCSKCKIEKSVTEFSFRCRAKGKRHPWCKPCTRNHNKNRYYANHAFYAKHHTFLTKNKRQEKMLKVLEYLQSHPCIDCGEADPVVLEFDHRDGTEKIRAVASLITDNCGWEKIAAEIEKCDVRCANCHRRRTAEVRGYTRAFLSKKCF
jgi:hypothetical protein